MGLVLQVLDDGFEQSVGWASWLGFSERRWYLRTAVQVLPVGVGEEDTHRQNDRVCNGTVTSSCFYIFVFQRDKIDFKLLVFLVRK